MATQSYNQRGIAQLNRVFLNTTHALSPDIILQAYREPGRR
jgi:hypothetical protein